MRASVLLRTARKRSGLDQGELARRTGTSQPDVSLVESGKRIPTVDTLERLLNGTGHKLIAVQTIHSDAAESATLISDALKSENPAAAFRRFLDYSDSLSKLKALDRLVLTLAEPLTTGSRLWDAALAAVVDLWLDDAGLPKPQWIESEASTLPTPQALNVSEYDPEPDVKNVPPQFLSRNVLVERSTLASV